jgi:Peptidase family M23
MTKNTSTPEKPEANSFSSITPGLSVQDFLNYKPNRDRDQDFDSFRNRRGKGPNVHNGIDYGSRAGITRNTDVSSVMNGVATPIENYYTKSGVTDSGVIVTGKDSQGHTVKITYGHLSAESVQKLFNGKSSISLNAGDVLGKVGSTGKDGRNEYHTHVKVEVDGKIVNPTEYFRQEYKSQTTTKNTLPESGKGAHESDCNHNSSHLHLENTSQSLHDESIALQRYQAIADILKDAGLQPGSSDWNKSIVQTAIGTDLDVSDIKDIARQIPGIKPNEAEKLVDGAAKDTQMSLA